MHKPIKLYWGVKDGVIQDIDKSAEELHEAIEGRKKAWTEDNFRQDALGRALQEGDLVLATNSTQDMHIFRVEAFTPKKVYISKLQEFDETIMVDLTLRYACDLVKFSVDDIG